MAILCSTPKALTPLPGFFASTHDLKTISPPSHFEKGHQFKNNPIKKISKVLFIIFFQNTASPAASNLGITKDNALPTAKRKKGKTRSVGVKPCQGACANGG